MQNDGPHPHVVVENRKGYLGCRGSHLRNEGSLPHTGLPSLEHWCWEEECPQCLAVTIKGDSLWVRQTVAENPDILLQGLHTDSLAHKHLP